MSPCLAHLRGGPRHGQTIEIKEPALCLLLPDGDGEAVYDLCATTDFTELIYRYSHTDRGEPLKKFVRVQVVGGSGRDCLLRGVVMECAATARGSGQDCSRGWA